MVCEKVYWQTTTTTLFRAITSFEYTNKFIWQQLLVKQKLRADAPHLICVRCFQLNAPFAVLHIVEYTNTNKFHLGCILFIQQILLQKHLLYPA